jgi:predicted MFS family arabinose efflux permease
MPEPRVITKTQIVIFAVACGIAVANLYYAQPLLETIGATFGVNEAAAGLVVTVTQIGYACGLVLLAPLGDLLENRRLILTVMCGTLVALAGATLAPAFPVFLAASLAIGVTTVVAQILVPLAAHFAEPGKRGAVVGQVMSGLLTGILLARAVAGLLSAAIGWRGVYLVSAIVMTLLIVVLARTIPARKPESTASYGALLASLVRIFRSEPVLRRRIAYHFAMFGSFSVFWTSITFLLSAAPFHLSTAWIGAFALAGAVGAIVAPIAGRLGDRGHGRIATGAALLLASAAFALTLLQASIAALIVGAIALDLAVQTNLVLGQQAIYALNPAERSRLNTLYISAFFLGGALGSWLAGMLYAHGGWPAVVALGSGMPLAAFLVWLTEARTSRASAAA